MRLRIEQDYWLFGIYNNCWAAFRLAVMRLKQRFLLIGNWEMVICLREIHHWWETTELKWFCDVYSSQQRLWPLSNVIMSSQLTAVSDSPLMVLSFLISKETAPVRQQHRWGLCATSIVFTSGSNKALHADVEQCHTLLASFYHSKLCITS